MINLDTDLVKIRDYVGSEPDDSTIEEIAETLTWWQEVAVRILRTREADLNGQQTTSFNLHGVISVGTGKADLTLLAERIKQLEDQIAELRGEQVGGVSVAQLTRSDRYR